MHVHTVKFLLVSLYSCEYIHINKHTQALKWYSFTTAHSRSKAPSTGPQSSQEQDEADEQVGGQAPWTGEDGRSTPTRTFPITRGLAMFNEPGLSLSVRQSHMSERSSCKQLSTTSVY